MTITTKFNLDDTAWTIHEGRAVQVEIKGFEIERGEQYDGDLENRTRYRVKTLEGYERFWAHEDACHQSKEALITAL